MSNIPVRQNESRQLQLLKAQRVLYSSSKKYFNWRTGLAFVFATFGPAIISLNIDLSGYAAVIIIAYLLLDKFFFERQEVKKRKSAAKVQELFDTTVLDLPWNKVVAGERPEEEIISTALHVKSRDKGEKLENWYATDVGRVEEGLARLLCQRTNAWWDTALRSSFITCLVALTVVLTTIAVGFCVVFKLPINQVVINMLWLIPLAELVIKQILKNHDASTTISELKINLESEIQEWMEGRGVENVALARTFQDQIFCHRCQCPMIPDWFYWIYRDRQETQMQFSIGRRVDEYLSH